MKYNIIIILLLLCMLTACGKEDSGLPEFRGIWVETSKGDDTMVFNDSEYDFSMEWFELRRESMTGTGPYYYRIEGDSIYLRWMLSSLYRDNPYFFSRMGEEEFLIGKFYDSDIRNAVLRFRKVD